MTRLVGGMLRTAERDFGRALRSGDGARRRCAARSVGIAPEGLGRRDDLREINRLLRA